MAERMGDKSLDRDLAIIEEFADPNFPADNLGSGGVSWLSFPGVCDAEHGVTDMVPVATRDLEASGVQSGDTHVWASVDLGATQPSDHNPDTYYFGRCQYSQEDYDAFEQET